MSLALTPCTGTRMPQTARNRSRNHSSGHSRTNYHSTAHAVASTWSISHAAFRKLHGALSELRTVPDLVGTAREATAFLRI